MTWITLPYPISANRYWRAIVIRGHAMMAPTSEAKKYKRDVGLLANAAGLRVSRERMVLEVRLYPNRPLDFAKRAARDPDRWDDTVQCLDLGNCEKVLSDALNGIAWVDDKQLRRIVLERMEPDAGGARLEIRITELTVTPIAPQLFAAAG